MKYPMPVVMGPDVRRDDIGVRCASSQLTVVPRLVRSCALGRGIQYVAASRFYH